MMKETFRIRLEAKNPEKGHHRACRIDAGQNFFGQWNIEVTYGRIGRRGQSVTYSATDDGGSHRHHPALSPKTSKCAEPHRRPYQIRELCDSKESAGGRL